MEALTTVLLVVFGLVGLLVAGRMIGPLFQAGCSRGWSAPTAAAAAGMAALLLWLSSLWPLAFLYLRRRQRRAARSS